MRFLGWVVFLFLFLLLCGCDSVGEPALQPAAAQAEMTSGALTEVGQWEGSLGGIPGDGVGIELSEVAGRLLGTGIVVRQGVLIPVKAIGVTEGEGGSFFLQLFPVDESVETDSYNLSGRLESPSTALFEDTATGERFEFTLERSDLIAQQVAGRLWEGVNDSDSERPERYRVRLTVFNDTLRLERVFAVDLVLASPGTLFEITGTWEAETPVDPPTSYRIFGTDAGSVRASAFAFSPINRIALAPPVSFNPFPEPLAELYFRRDIEDAGTPGSRYPLESDSWALVTPPNALTVMAHIQGAVVLVDQGKD